MTLEELLARDDVPQELRRALRRRLSEQEPDAVERAWRASEERYRRITEAITDYTYSVRVENGRAVETRHGPACEAVTGYRVEEYAADPTLWYRMVCVEDLPLVQEQARRTLAGEDAPAIEHRLVRKDGSIRWVRNTIVPHRDSHGRLLAYDGVVTDVTERRLAEEALRDSEERFSKAFRAAPVSMSIIVLADGTFLDVNDEGLRVSGFSREEVVGRRVGETDWISTADRRRLVRTLRQEGRVAGLELIFRAKSGREILGLVRGEQIVVDGRDCLLVAMVDVTERRRAEEERLALQRQVLHTQKLESLGVLAGGIAHDFNNLLVAILGNASLAATALPQDAALLGPLGDIEAAARRASELCSQLLAYSGRGTFVVETLDLNQVIEEMVNLIRISISKKAELRLEPAERPLLIEADATQLRQVILNLVVNASEAIGDAAGTITVSTGSAQAGEDVADGPGSAERLATGRCACLEVTDTGIGMDAETQRRLFDPFFTTKFAGRGLGLSAVLGIVRGHHGAIRVTSQRGSGTSFRVLFPLLDDDAVLARPLRTAAEAGLWQGQGTVLVVDDDASVRSVAARMIERHGLRVLQAADGSEGVQVFRGHATEIVLVLLDLTMPRLAGAEALREIRTRRAEVPVILMSGYGEDEAAQLVTGQQVQAFLQKPFDAPQLSQTLRAVLPLTALVPTPLLPTPPPAAAPLSPTPPPSGGDGACILLVDDDPQVREVGRALLEHLGHTVLTADDGRQALAQYSRLADEIDLVILDQSMPGLDGEATFHALREAAAGIRVLFASGHLDPDLAREVLEQGAAGFVQKPYTILQLGRAVSVALAGRRPGLHA